MVMIDLIMIDKYDKYWIDDQHIDLIMIDKYDYRIDDYHCMGIIAWDDEEGD